MSTRPSSVKSFAIGKRIDEITESLARQEKSYKSKRYVSIDEFVRYLLSQFPIPTNRFEEELDSFGKYFVLCQSVYSSMFEIWDDFDFDKEFFDSGRTSNSFKSLHKILKDIVSLVKVYDEDNLPFEDSIQSLCTKLDKFEDEFKEVKSFRSSAYSFKSEILQKCRAMRLNNELSQKQFNNISNKCNALIDEFNYIYNRVISKQHHGLFVDMMSKEFPVSSSRNLTIRFDPRLSEFLFLSSWKDFDELLNDSGIQIIRKQIDSFWGKLSSDNFVPSHDDDANLSYLFLLLDTTLQKHYLPKLNQLVKNKSNHRFNSKAASTNYFGTEKLAFGNGECGRFIGNGCVLGDSHTDKLSLYLPNENHGITIFNLCFGEHLDDKKSNTISLTNM